MANEVDQGLLKRWTGKLQQNSKTFSMNKYAICNYTQQQFFYEMLAQYIFIFEAFSH